MYLWEVNNAPFIGISFYTSVNTILGCNPSSCRLHLVPGSKIVRASIVSFIWSDITVSVLSEDFTPLILSPIVHPSHVCIKPRTDFNCITVPVYSLLTTFASMSTWILSGENWYSNSTFPFNSKRNNLYFLISLINSPCEISEHFLLRLTHWN